MSHKSLLVNIASLKRIGDTKHEAREVSMPGLAVIDTVVSPEARINLEVLLERIEGGVSARGVVRTPWQSLCRRCLKDVLGTMKIEVKDLFTNQTDESTYPLKHDQIDLEPMVRDAILLELPQAPLCEATCQGLCPICGIDRNIETCTCVIGGADARWSALDVLREDN